MSLAQLEQFFWRGVRSASPPNDLAEVFREQVGLGVERRLGIYHHAYFFRQQQVLSELFPQLCVQLGADDFLAKARDYIEARPSQTPIIEHIGRGFPDFLADSAVALDPALLDLARFEWALVEALLAPDARAVLTPGDLAHADPLACCVRAAPAVRLLEVRREALTAYGAPPAGEGGGPERVFVVVTRKHGVVVHVELDETSAGALRRSLAGETLASVFAEFGGDDGVERATRCLTQILKLELWSEITSDARS